MRPIGRVGDGDSVQDWFHNIPLVTKSFLLGTVGTAALVTFGTFSFNFLMHTVVLYQSCSRYEENPFNTGGGGNSSDVLFMVLFGMFQLVIIGYFMNMYIFSESIMYMIIYVWSRRVPEQILSMYGFKFKALYVPWVYLGINMLMGGSIQYPFIGIVIGHVYYFLVEVAPAKMQRDILRTPQFCISIYNKYLGVRPSPNVPNNFANLGGGHNWGRGRTLGSQ